MDMFVLATFFVYPSRPCFDGWLMVGAFVLFPFMIMRGLKIRGNPVQLEFRQSFSCHTITVMITALSKHFTKQHAAIPDDHHLHRCPSLDWFYGCGDLSSQFLIADHGQGEICLLSSTSTTPTFRSDP